MKKNIQLLALICCCLLSGCDSWLDVKPYDQIGQDELMKSEEGFQKLLNGIYIELNDANLYGAALSVEMIEVMGGAYEVGTDAVSWSNYITLNKYQYETEYWRGQLDKTWNKAYALILNCNQILGNMESRKDIFTGDHYHIIRGEVLALRAMLHFDMLRLFGPVYAKDKDKMSIPYYTKQVMTPEELLSAAEVAEKVIADLKEARVLLGGDPVITEGTLMSGTPGGSSNFLRFRALRLNYYAVTGLLARVCLYTGQKQEAYAYATDVIKASNKGVFPFVDKSLVTGSPADPDRIFSSEVLFALSHSSRGQLFKDYYAPNRLPSFIFRMETELLNNIIFGGSAENGGNQDDYRSRVNWIATGSNKYFYKYSDMVETGKIQNTMIPMLRLGEMYLIAAESQSADLASGVSFVNTLRRQRGVANLPALTENTLRYEYIRELYGEGQLFFLYKRMNATIVRSFTDSKNTPPSDLVFVVPLPDSETENR